MENMSSSSMSDFSEVSDIEEELATKINTLVPFDMEPRKKIDDKNFELGADSFEDHLLTTNRIGNIKWCKCGERCQAMKTEEESLCCRDTNEIPDDNFKGMFE